jgi:hypothetical protein
MLDVDQQCQPLGERHGVNLGLLQLRGQCVGHGSQAQVVQLLNGRLVHLVSLLLDRWRRSSVVVAGAANVAVMADAILGHGVDEWPPALEQVLDKA